MQGYTGAGSSIPVPSLLDQLNTFLTHTPPSHKEAQKILWVVYAGGNNAFFSSPDSDIVEETVDDLQTAIRRIKSIGSSHFSPLSSLDSIDTVLRRWDTLLTCYTAPSRDSHALL